MYSVKVTDQMMIAHSLNGEVFGPARNLHGATYVVDAEFCCQNLDKNNLVIDIGNASEILKEVVSKLDYQNLDELPVFEGQLTTTEFLAKYVHDKISEKIGSFEGYLKVTLHESPNAAAGYEGKINH